MFGVQVKPRYVDIQSLNQFASELKSASPVTAESLTPQVKDVNQRWGVILQAMQDREVGEGIPQGLSSWYENWPVRMTVWHCAVVIADMVEFLQNACNRLWTHKRHPIQSCPRGRDTGHFLWVQKLLSSILVTILLCTMSRYYGPCYNPGAPKWTSQSAFTLL